jgi:uncharacterized protein (TIGR02266 family)
MPDERRSSHRIHLSGVRVTYESAGGESIEADVLDLGTGGVFVRTAAPLPVGKRISLEIQVIGERGPWGALGRVVWVREKGEGDKAPPGMAVKFIDADEAVLAAIERLVDTRERTEPGVGKSTPPPAASPVVVVAPERERTLMGVGLGTDEGRDPSVPIELVPRRTAQASASALAPASAPAPAPARLHTDNVPPRSGPGRLLVILLLLAVAGVAAYVLLDGFLRPPGR